MPRTAASARDDLVEACLAGLRAAHVDALFERAALRAARNEFEGTLTARTAGRRAAARFLVDIKRTHLSYALVAGLVARVANLDRDWILLAPHVGPPMGRYLVEHGVSYADAVGNCHVSARGGRELLVHVEGKRALRKAVAHGAGRVPANQVLLAVLARPQLLEAPVRTIAEAAGVGKTAVSDQLARLREQGLIGQTTRGYHLIRPRDLLDRWIAGYSDVVRPQWFVGRYRIKSSSPDALEAAVAKALGDREWALGGASAGFRLTRYYRSDEVVVHMPGDAAELTKRLRALPADDGPLIVLRTTPPVAYDGSEPHLAAPILVYTEMVTSADERTRVAAARVRELLSPELRA